MGRLLGKKQMEIEILHLREAYAKIRELERLIRITVERLVSWAAV